MYSDRLFPAYQMSPNPPKPMNWDEYESRATAEWQTLLNSAEGCDERRIRAFLVEHPCVVFSVGSAIKPSSCAPCGGALLSKSALREWVHTRDRYEDTVGITVPDFIWIAYQSGCLTPVLVKIASPCQRWFTDSGDPHPGVVPAIDELANWRAWFSRPANMMAFCADFGEPRSYKNLKPEFALMYGRQKEFQDQPDLRRRLSQFDREDQVLMTFDDLKPLTDYRGYICAAKTSNRYRALSVPPTLRLGPRNAWVWSRFQGVEEAILKNEWISLERGHFLAKRISFWAYWARSPGPLRSRANWEDWE